MACGCNVSGLGATEVTNVQGIARIEMCPCPPGHPLYPKSHFACCPTAAQAAASGGSSTLYYAIGIAAVAGIAYFGYKVLK